MRNLFLLALLAVSLSVKAQAPFTTRDSLDINNITAAVMVHGDMWWNPALEVAACEFPAHSGKNVNFAGSLWLSGYDAGNNLHIAAQTYRQTGNDYWPGPLDTSDTLTYATSTKWAYIWKVNRTDIETFLSLGTHTLTNTPQSILYWPGNGNTYAQGNGGAALTITTDMAPFVDLNGNGIYEPLLGEYPAFPGDQALWWVFSDNGPTHTSTNGKPLGVEVHALSYGYSRGTLIDNVAYYEYDIINRSANNYTNFRLAQWDEARIGWYFDNYIGFDSVWRMGIIYKGDNCDGCSSGYPVNYYGLDPPQSAVTMIVLPGDNGTNYVPVGSFTYYNNDFSIIGNPTVDTQYNNYMRAKIANGEHFSDDFRGADSQTVAYGSGPYCNYVFPGDPSDSSQWSECVCRNGPGDWRYVLASNDFTLNAGTAQKIVMALIVADTARGCPVTSFNDIKIVADTAWGVYNTSLLAVTNVTANNPVKVYPNPAQDKLYIETTGTIVGTETIMIYNVLGQMINVPLNKSGKTWSADVGTLPNGVYDVLYNNGGSRTNAKFVKE